MSDTLTETIAAPADKIIEALTGFEAFTEWQSAVKECEVLERDSEGRGTLVHMLVDAKVRKLDYVVSYRYDDLPAGLSWEMVSGDMKENTGVYSFAERADGGTDVTVDLVAEVGFFVPGPMKKLIKDQSLKNSIRELRKRVGG